MLFLTALSSCVLAAAPSQPLPGLWFWGGGDNASVAEIEHHKVSWDLSLRSLFTTSLRLSLLLLLSLLACWSGDSNCASSPCHSPFTAVSSLPVTVDTGTVRDSDCASPPCHKRSSSRRRWRVDLTCLRQCFSLPPRICSVARRSTTALGLDL